MSDRIASVKLFFDAFESGITDLTSHERGVYLTLCLRYYATGGKVLDDDRTLARASNCSLQAYRKTKAKLIDLGKIAVVDGLIYQPRADIEYTAAVKRFSKWKSWKRKKDAKKMQKSSDLEPENPNEISHPPEENITVGYDTPKGVYHNLPHEAVLALEALHDACGGDGEQEFQAFVSSIEGWDDGTFFLSGRYTHDRFSESLRTPLAQAKLSLEIKRPQLKPAAALAASIGGE